MSWPDVSARAQATGAGGWLQVDASGDPCIEPDALRVEAEGLLAHTPPETVRVQAQAEDDGWSIELWHPTGERAQRALSGLPEACGARRHALGLAIALAVEHAVSPQVEPPETATEAATEPPPQEAAPEPTGGTQLDTAWFVEVGLGASLNDLSQPSPIATASVMLELGALLGIELRALAALRAAQASIAEGTLSTRNVGAALGPCLGGAALGGRLMGCVELELAAVLGQGDGLAQDAGDATLSGAVLLASGMRWKLSGAVFFTVRAEALLRFLRPTYGVTDAGGTVLDTEQLPVAGARLLIGVGWRAE